MNFFYSKELNNKSSDPYHGSGSERSAEGYLKGATNMFIFYTKIVPEGGDLR